MPIALRRGLYSAMALVSVATLVLGSLLIAPSPVLAQGFHSHARAITIDSAWAQTGLYVYRPDSNVTIAVPNCAESPTLGAGEVVYQSQWMGTQGTGTDWFELGTGHRGPDCRFWFWGFGDAQGWHPYGHRFISTYASHQFYFYRLGVNWAFWIDSCDPALCNVWNIPSTWSGTQLQAGIETYQTSSTAPAADYGLAADPTTKLQYTVAEGPWLPWPSNANTWGEENPPAPLCGRWVSYPTQFRAGENTTC